MQVNQKKTELIVVLLLASLFVVLPIQMAKAQTTTVSVSPQTSTASVGKTVTVAIQLSNVQNLYSFDVTLSYNNAVLQLTNSKLDLGTSSIPGGVLYGDPVSTNIVSGGVYYNTSLSTSSDYELIATSENTAGNTVGPFSGSGTIVTLTFTVLSSGQSPLTLNVQLASYAQPGSGEVSEPISATVVNGNFATTSSSSSPSGSQTPSSSPSKTPSSSSSASSSPSATSSSPLKSLAFPVLLAIIVVVVVVLVTLAVVFSRKRTQKTPS
jgi:hypothetical protein